MAGNEAIVIPIIIDPKAGAAGLRVIGDEAAKTNAKMSTVAQTAKKFGGEMKTVLKSMVSLPNVAGLATAGIALLVSELFRSSAASQKAEEAYAKYQQILSGSIASVAQEAARVETLVRVIQLETTSRQQRLKAVEDLQKIAPAYFANLDKEKASVVDITRAYDRYVLGIQRAVEAKVTEKQLEAAIEKRLKLERELGSEVRPVNTVVKNGQIEVQSYNAIYISKDDLLEKTKELNSAKQEELDLSKKLALLRPQGDAFIPTVTPKAIKIKPQKTEFDLVGSVVDIKLPNIEAYKQAFDFSGLKSVEDRFGAQTGQIKNAVDALNQWREKVRLNQIENEKWIAQNERIAGQATGLLAPAFTSLFDAILSKQDAFKSFFNAIGQSIKQLIAQLIQAAIQAAFISLLTGGAAGGGLSFGKAFSKVLGFASGGLVTGPVSALVGEGQGTRASNPEVVAPLDKLKTFFASMLPTNKNFNGFGNMGTAGMQLALPQEVRLYQSGRDMVGVLTLEQQYQKRSG